MTSTIEDAEPGRVRAQDTEPLRLVALDADDLAILSAHLQDALVNVTELAYLPRERRFALVGKRYDWVKAAKDECERCAVGLHFECVLSVARTGFAQDEADRVLHLLAIVFEPGDAPGGTVSLTFAGGAAVRLKVECLEAQLSDLGERFPCDKVLPHPIDETLIGTEGVTSAEGRTAKA